MGLLDDLDRRRESNLRDKENSARLAHSYAVFVTEGQGTQQFEDRIDFGLTFIEKPVVGYASGCDVDELANLMEIEDETLVPLPVCSGHVTHWDQDERDFYVGCWVAVRVNFPYTDLVDPELMPECEHHFTFSGVGMKDIPPELGDDADE